MIFIGMIYQYDDTQGTGLLMLSDGEKKEFNVKDWVDSVNQPSIGQKISYELDTNRVRIKIASENDINKAQTNKEQASEKEKKAPTDIGDNFADLDDCLTYFTGRDFNLVKDIQNGSLRTLTLRKYTPVEYGEAVIKQEDSRLSVMLTLNGKAVEEIN